MAEIKVKSPLPAWQTDKSTWVYLTIPSENSIGEAHPNVWLNREEFKAGQTRLVPKEVYDTVSERLRVYAKACVRLLQPRRDMDAVNAVGIGSVAGHGATPVDPTTIPAMNQY